MAKKPLTTQPCAACQTLIPPGEAAVDVRVSLVIRGGARVEISRPICIGCASNIDSDPLDAVDVMRDACTRILGND